MTQNKPRNKYSYLFIINKTLQNNSLSQQSFYNHFLCTYNTKYKMLTDK